MILVKFLAFYFANIVVVLFHPNAHTHVHTHTEMHPLARPQPIS